MVFLKVFDIEIYCKAIGCVIILEGQKNRPLEHNKMPQNSPTHIWSLIHEKGTTVGKWRKDGSVNI